MPLYVCARQHIRFNCLHRAPTELARNSPNKVGRISGAAVGEGGVLAWKSGTEGGWRGASHIRGTPETAAYHVPGTRETG